MWELVGLGEVLDICAYYILQKKRMKKILKIILAIVLILIIGLFIRPQKVFYEAKIIGKVVDESGIPISDAIVSRIEKKSSINKKYGYHEYTTYKSQTVRTNKDGNFQLDEKSRIEWFHTPLDLPFVHCYANFEVEKTGFKRYETKFGEFQQDSKEPCYACEKIEFKPTIILKNNN